MSTGKMSLTCRHLYYNINIYKGYTIILLSYIVIINTFWVCKQI